MDTPCGYLWGRVTRFIEGEEIAEEGAEDGEGDEDEAESLFGTGGGPLVVMTSAATKYRRTNHAHSTTLTSFPVELISRGLKGWLG